MTTRSKQHWFFQMAFAYEFALQVLQSLKDRQDQQAKSGSIPQEQWVNCSSSEAGETKENAAICPEGTNSTGGVTSMWVFKVASQM